MNFGKLNKSKQFIFKEVQGALNKYGYKYLHDYETKYGYSGVFGTSTYKILFSVPFINPSDIKVNDCDHAILDGVKIEFPNNDYWALRGPKNSKEFWKTWNEFKRLQNLKVFW